MITVRLASAIRTPGFGRIELETSRKPDADWLEKHREDRALASAALTVAAELERIAGGDGLEFEISLTKVRHGILDVDFRSERVDQDIISEILIDACGQCGFWPTDALVELGEINPTGEPEECEDNACAGCAWCDREVGK